jgi:hypothetical protein
MKSGISGRSCVRWLLAASAMALATPEAGASEAISRPLLEVTIEGSNYARLSVSGSAIGGRPGCHTAGFTVHYAWDISTTKGKAMLSMAQAALLAGRRVNVTGTGTCTNTGLNQIETLTILTIWQS